MAKKKKNKKIFIKKEEEEKLISLINKGLCKNKIIGIDEAGRGPLAGPVVASAVKIKNRKEIGKIKNIFKNNNFLDSKKISAKERKRIYQVIIKNPVVEYGVGIVSEKLIDKINILEATKHAMKKALKKLNDKDSVLFIDGNFKIDSRCKQMSIIKADEKILECALASIIAKVKRDNIMEEYHKVYPHYGFNKNKGYGTKKHREMIKKYGPCLIHRKSFRVC